MWVFGESFHWDRFGGQIGGREGSSLEDHLLGENCSFLKEEFQYSNMLEMTYSFLDRLINLGLPRTRDFQGLSPNSFDGHGNYSIMMREQGAFPELRYDALGKPRGMDVCITTTTKTDEEGHKLLALMGMPFREGGGQQTIVRKKKLKKHHFDTKSKGRR